MRITAPERSMPMVAARVVWDRPGLAPMMVMAANCDGRMSSEPTVRT
ncbi:hypothetical protein amb2988 [Paramagnetospirillum magneticum AMB-1]|uniref:Uncharacterized protein n=1 Tax=Paramagnetospirillum magneticum (strain ATCC 700264 / AMB-1) TaxID=342108 RepID=Q2W2Y3_PARM1|nr:hypothetical protein amb2988 [Paramagnetospirillum magneticum AMB-1]